MAFNKKSISLDTKSNGKCRNSTRKPKANTIESIAFDTKSNGNHRKTITKSIAFATKSKRKLQEINRNSTRCTEHRILTQFSASSPHALKRTSHRLQ